MEMDKCECNEAFDEDTGAPLGNFTCDSCHVKNGDCSCDQSEMCGWCDMRPKEIVDAHETFAVYELHNLLGEFEQQRIDYEQLKNEGMIVPSHCKKDSLCVCDSCVFKDKLDINNVDRSRFEKWMQMSDYNKYYYWTNFCENDSLEIVKWFASFKANTFDHLDPSKWFSSNTLSKVWIARKLKNI